MVIFLYSITIATATLINWSKEPSMQSQVTASKFSVIVGNWLTITVTVWQLDITLDKRNDGCPMCIKPGTIFAFSTRISGLVSSSALFG